jgi:hypothetical protein
MFYPRLSCPGSPEESRGRRWPLRSGNGAKRGLWLLASGQTALVGAAFVSGVRFLRGQGLGL